LVTDAVKSKERSAMNGRNLVRRAFIDDVGASRDEITAAIV
jgi:hypothetical protein